jgi:uncharacterized membrane protein required for colicin V production
MIVDLVALTLVGALVYVGWRRGWILMALSLVGFVAGYVAAMFLYRPVGGLLVSFAGMPAVLAYPVGGLAAMLVVSMTVRLLRRRVLHRRMRKEREGWEPSRIDRGGGAVIAGCVGVGFAIVAAWMATALTELGGRRVPGLAESYTARMGAAVAESTIYAALRLARLDPQVAASIAGVMARPGRAASALQNMMRSDVFGSAREDRSFRDAFLSGDAAALAGHPMMERMLGDPSFQQAFEVLNLSEGSGGMGARTQGLAATLGTLGSSLQTLQGDDEFRASPLATQIQEGISSGSLDLVSLTRSPQLASMLEQINASFRARERAVEAIGR